MRLFNVKLEILCENMVVPGKAGKYIPVFNSIHLTRLKKTFQIWIKYAEQDSIALLMCMHKAQNMYLNNYGVDLATVWSTSTLALKIFRLNFLNETIPSLNSSVDTFVRKAYFGRSNWSL
jgi:hypothetical protein